MILIANESLVCRHKKKSFSLKNQTAHTKWWFLTQIRRQRTQRLANVTMYALADEIWRQKIKSSHTNIKTHNIICVYLWSHCFFFCMFWISSHQIWLWNFCFCFYFVCIKYFNLIRCNLNGKGETVQSHFCAKTQNPIRNINEIKSHEQRFINGMQNWLRIQNASIFDYIDFCKMFESYLEFKTFSDCTICPIEKVILIFN